MRHARTKRGRPAQAALAFDGDPCLIGEHPVIVDGEPRALGACVNVESYCLQCGLRVMVTSYSLEGWARAQQRMHKG